MLLLRLKIVNRINYFIASSCVLLLISCTSGVKPSNFSAHSDMSMDSLKGNMGLYKKKKYVDFIRPICWDAAVECGFLSNNNAVFNYNQNNDLEEGLGYIFFNTLRYKLSKDTDDYVKELGLWVNNIDDEDNPVDVNNKYPSFICPRPWKYEVRDINKNQEPYGVFYLDSVLMAEYHKFNDHIINNYTNVESNRSPHTKIYYRDKHRNDQNTELNSLSVIVEIDHLLKDNSYLIELPKGLHKLKTSVLDPFILGKTETERLFNRRQYWGFNNDYVAIQDSRSSNTCPCGEVFQPPNGNVIVEHTHDRIWLNNFTNNWMPKMKGANMP